jgi:hypothetical protein
MLWQFLDSKKDSDFLEPQIIHGKNLEGFSGRSEPSPPTRIGPEPSGFQKISVFVGHNTKFFALYPIFLNCNKVIHSNHFIKHDLIIMNKRYQLTYKYACIYASKYTHETHTSFK